MSWKDLTDVDHRAILEAYDNMSFNLASNNKAEFQKGILSVPTQFWHVQTKYIEALVGKQFTIKEKIRLFIGQLMIYGAAGVPAGYILLNMFGQEAQDENGNVDMILDEATVRGGLTSYLTGGVAQTSQRGALAFGIEKYVTALFNDDNKELWQKAMGASGNIFSRSSYAYHITKAFAFSVDDAILDVTAMDTLLAWGSLASSVNNATAAYDMHILNRFRDKNKGRVNFENPAWQEVMSKALGFTTTRGANMWENNKQLKDRTKWKTAKVDAFFKIMYARGFDPYAESSAEMLAKSVPLYATIWGGGTQADADEIAKSIWRKLKATRRSKEDTVLKSMIKHSTSSRITTYKNEEK